MHQAAREGHRVARRRRLEPEHLYKFAGLLFLLALAFDFFNTISRVLLIAYAAGIVAVGLNAVVTRLPVRRKWATALLGMMIFTALGAALWFGGRAVLAQLSDLIENAPAMEQELRDRAEELREQTGLDVALVGERTVEAFRSVFSGDGGGDVLGPARGLLEWLTVPVLILFGALFALGNPNDHLLVPVLRAVPAERRPAFRRIFELLGERLQGWIKGQAISMVTIGVLATAAFWLIGVPYALLLGTVNGLAEVVPIIGPWAGGIPAVVIAFLDEPSKGLWTLLAILVIQQIESNLVTPFVMSKTAEVHPFVTLFSLVLFGGIFGFLGVLLALPIVLFLWTVVQVLWVERAIDASQDQIAPVVGK